MREDGWWAFPLLAAGLLVLAVVVWSPFPGGIWHDDGVYLLLGRALEAGEGLRYVGVAGDLPAGKFPPVYPALLAGIWWLAGSVDWVSAGAAALNFAFLISAALLFARFLVRYLDTPLAVAAAVAGITWLSLTLWNVALLPFSEPLFLLLTIVAVTLACRSERTTGDRVGWLLLVLVLLASIYVRTIGVATALAAVAALAARGRSKVAGVTLMAVIGGTMPWVVWSRRAGSLLPEPLRDVLGPYGPWLVGQIRENPVEYLLSLQDQGRYLVARVLAFLFPAPGVLEPWFADLRWIALLVVVPALLLGLDRVWRHGRTPVLFLFAYLGIVWLWPFRDDRLLVPIIPFLFLVIIEGFRAGTQRWKPEDPVDGTEEAEEAERKESTSSGGLGVPRAWKRAWHGVGIGWAVLFVGMTLWSLTEGRPGTGYRIQTPVLARVVQAVGEATPESAVVGAPEFWAAIHLHTGRTVAPSARFLPARPLSRGPVWGTPEEQHRLWDVAGIDHLVLERNGGIHGDALDLMVERCGADAVRLVATWQGGRMVRLAWDPECRRMLLADSGGGG